MREGRGSAAQRASIRQRGAGAFQGRRCRPPLPSVVRGPHIFCLVHLRLVVLAKIGIDHALSWQKVQSIMHVEVKVMKALSCSYVTDKTGLYN